MSFNIAIGTVGFNEEIANTLEQGNMENIRGRKRMLDRGTAATIFCPDKTEHRISVLMSRGAYYGLNETKLGNTYYLNPDDVPYVAEYIEGEEKGIEYYAFNIFRCRPERGNTIVFQKVRTRKSAWLEDDRKEFLDEIAYLVEECDLQILD